MASRVRRNAVANLLGTGWIAAVQLVATPLLLWKLGVSAYGLVGFYATLLAVLAILDLGLSPTLTRHMARFASVPSEAGHAANTLRTFEVLFALAGVVVGAAIALAAATIAEHWLHSASMPSVEIEASVRLMGLLFALRWLQAPYVATLQGLQHQAVLSIVNAGMYTLINACALGALWVFSPSVTVFFGFLASGTLVQLLVVRWFTLHASPMLGGPARFDASVIKSGFGFSAGVLGISITATLLTQTDKVVLSRLVPLEEFGLYAAAQVLAAGLSVAILPLFNAAYPRLCELSASGDSRLAGFYASGNNAMSAVVIPTAATLLMFSHEVLYLWTANLPLADRAAPVLSLLVLGTALNGLMFISYALQLARGNTALGLRINSALCLLAVPCTVFLTLEFGIVGAASVWAGVNALYLAVGLPLTFRSCLASSRWAGFYGDLLRHQGPSLLVVAAARLLIAPSSDRLWLGVEVLCVFAASLVVSVLMTPAVREPVLGMLRSLGTCSVPR